MVGGMESHYDIDILQKHGRQELVFVASTLIPKSISST